MKHSPLLGSTSVVDDWEHELKWEHEKVSLWSWLFSPSFVWLFIFCGTGVGLGLSFEFLDLQSKNGKPVSEDSFFLCFVGYVAQTLVGTLYTLYSSRRSTRTEMTGGTDPLRGSWTWPVLRLLFLSALLDGAAQGLDFVGQLNGGYLLFTIFHSSVTVFSCAIAIASPLRARITPPQWAGVLLVVVGVTATAIPAPLATEGSGSFVVGVLCSLAGSLCLAGSYPVSELVFKVGATLEKGPVSEEAACTIGSLLNTLIFTGWTLAWTLPRWEEKVADHAKAGRSSAMAWGFVLYGAMVGLHSLSFWKSIHKMGTVSTAVAKGAQQAGIFVFSHLVYCGIDEAECMTNNSGSTLWSKMQKSVAFFCCTLGVVVYALNKNRHDYHGPRKSHGDQEEWQRRCQSDGVPGEHTADGHLVSASVPAVNKALLEKESSSSGDFDFNQ